MPGTDAKLQTPDFSLVLGGPIYQLCKRVGLFGDEMDPLPIRVIVISMVGWLPLFVLSLVAGHAYGVSRLAFLNDITVHTRFLVALPILIAGELWVHRRIGSGIKRFLDRDIVSGHDVPKFNLAIASANRLRDSKVLEIGLIVIVYTVGLWFWRSQMAVGGPSWYADPDGTNMNLTPAGYWFAFVSVPLCQFIILRWYVRFFIWFRFLRQISALDLNLIATHPDKTGGLAFLGKCTYSFVPILFAQGALLSGLIASEVIQNGRNLMEFKVEAIAMIIFFVGIAISPLFVFLPSLARTKRQGLAKYGSLASRYVIDFENKWINGASPDGETFLGSGDVQSLADLGNSYAVVREMNVVPFSLNDLLRLTAVAAAPLLPLTFFVFSLEELADRLLKVIL